MPTISRNSNPTLYVPDYDKAWQEGYDDKKLYTPARDVLFTHMTDNSKALSVTAIGDIIRPQTFGELQPVPRANIKELWQKTFTHGKEGLGIDISYEARDDEEKTAFMSQTNIAKKLGFGTKIKQEINLESVFANAFNVAYPGPDGVALCSTTHDYSPTLGTHWSNLLGAVEFSADNLDAMEKKIDDNSVNSNGDKINILGLAKYIVHGPQIRNIVDKVIGRDARLMGGTGDREVNPFAGRYQSVELPYLPAAAKLFWYLVIPGSFDMGLVFITRQNALIEAWTDYKLKAHVIDIWCRYTYGWYDPRAVWGANPS